MTALYFRHRFCFPHLSCSSDYPFPVLVPFFLGEKKKKIKMKIGFTDSVLRF
jgi:hypothetical protein